VKRIARVGLFLCFAFPSLLWAAPNITDANLRGLQIGGSTTLVLNGNDLLPNPVLVASFPISAQTVKPDAKRNRIELEVQVAPNATPGIYQIRVATAKGISNPIVIGLDRFLQLPFAASVDAMPVALHGTLTGTQILSTKIRGTKGQRLVADVESQRLGAQLKPVLRIKDSRGRQIAWSPTLSRIAGDARVEFQVPADDDYTVEMHDMLFRGAAPGYFRLKIGELHFADLAFPLGVQAGSKTRLIFLSGNIPPETSSEMDTSSLTFPADLGAIVPPLPGYSGSQPQIVVTQHPEVVEVFDNGGVRQVLPAFPVAVSGRIAKDKEEDQFAFPTKPGTKLRIDVLAMSVGSPLDGVLTISNESGSQLAINDDRPGNSDPGLEFQVPENTNQLIVGIKDLLGRGGADFVYRIEISDAAAPQFSVTADSDRLNISAEATQAFRVQVNRVNYNGKIKLAFQGLPPNVQVTGDEISEGATVGLMTLTAGPGSPTGSLVKLMAQGVHSDMSTLTRVVRTPETKTSKQFPWFRDEFALAVSEPAPVRVAWAGPVESPMFLGEKLPLTVSLARADGAKGKVRLRLLTTQVMPRKKVKEMNREQEVDDIDRALRLEGGELTVDVDAKQATANVVVPADLPVREWGLVVAADVLAADDQTVVATTTTTAIAKTPVVPFSVELVSTSDLEAKAGLGDTGKLVGKVKRQGGFAQPIVLTLEGLPKEYASPKTTVAADKEDFEFPVSFAFGSKPTELKNIKLVAQFQPDPKKAELLVRSSPVSVGVIKVVPGEPPPPGQLLAIFEDDEKFISYLSKGGGQITLDTQDKYSGTGAAKVTPDQRYNEEVPGLNVKIRENPGPGEYRYLRFAWKKKGGAAVCLQLNHDGAWGVGGSGKPGAKFRYHAGPAGECYGASLAVDDKLPEGFVVVTRDLFADFGDFTLTGLAFSPVDGEYALFDHLHLARAQADFEQLKK
jgi:hypothetical protein